MAGTYLFDTNIFVDILRGNKSAIDKANTLTDPVVSAIVLGELHFGAHLSGDLQRKTFELESLIGGLKILPATKRTAEIFGEVKFELRKTGTPIPENDIWIAATALEHGLTVLTGDKHFANIDGLKLELWVREEK